VAVARLTRARANPMAVETDVAVADADRMLAGVADGLHVDAARTCGGRFGGGSRRGADEDGCGGDCETCPN